MPVERIHTEKYGPIKPKSVLRLRETADGVLRLDPGFELPDRHEFSLTWLLKKWTEGRVELLCIDGKPAIGLHLGDDNVLGLVTELEFLDTGKLADAIDADLHLLPPADKKEK